MRKTIRDNKKLFYVVQFIELPFKGIEDYVCVPYSWLILQRSLNGKVVVTYPVNEDIFDTRDRVKRKEKPDEDWRFYMAHIKYESDNYMDAEYWISLRNNCGPGEEESIIKDTQPDPKLNKKLRYASQSSLSGPNSDKSQLEAKPYSNPRKPLPKMLIKRRLSQKPDENLNYKRLKLNGNSKPSAVTNHTIVASRCSTQEQSLIITDNEFIQNDQTKTSSASNGEMNTVQSTQPEVIKEKQSLEISIESTSPKLTAEQHPSSKLLAEQKHSGQPSTEQQLLPHPTTYRIPSPLPIDQEQSPNLIGEQHPSSKLLAEQQPSPIGQDDEQPLSMSVIELDESDENIESCHNVLPKPVIEKILPTKTPPNILEQAPQPELVNEKSTPLVRHENSFPEPHRRDESAEQSKEFNDSRKTHLHSILITPRIEQRPPSTINQPSHHLEHLQLPILPVSSTLNSKLRSIDFVGKNSTKVAGDYQTPCSQDCRDSTPSTSYHGSNWGMLSEPVAKTRSAAVKHCVDKNTRFKRNSKNITNMQYPFSSMMQLIPGNPAITQAAPSTQTQFRQAQVNGSLVNNVRYNWEQKYIHQNVPTFQGIVNTSAEQNSMLAHQYRPFIGASREQQYLPTQADYLQQLTSLQEMLKMQNASTIDQRVYHQNAMMNRGFVVPNPINQPVQFLPRNENQYIPVNNAYAQEVIRHDPMRGPTDGSHATYNPNVQNAEKVQLFDCYSSSQSHQNSEHPQQKQYPLIYRDRCTASTQDDLTLKLKHSSHMSQPQKIIDRPQSLSMSKSSIQELLEVQRSRSVQEQGVPGKINPNSTQYSYNNLAAFSDNLTIEPAPFTQDAGVQTMTSPETVHEARSTLIHFNHTNQLSRTNKTMVDRATETNLMMNVDHCIDKKDNACQTDEWLTEEQSSPYQESSLETESENELDSEVYEKNLTNVRNVTPEDQQRQSRILAEQDILNAIGNVTTRMGLNFSIIRDICNFYRNFIVESTEEYKTLIEKVDKFNSGETLQIPTSPPNNVTSQVLQVTPKKPAGDGDNPTNVGNTVTSIPEHRGKFSLPAEYDPNDTKWTLKYRENKPGLVELLPRTGVYVSKKELKRCIRQSNDCSTLARLLLTEIFSQNALSVCSLSGGKAKAFSSVNIDVRPGLDEHARMVLLTFVEEHGNKRGWLTSDTAAIMNSIRSKINEIRAKHGQTCKA